MNEKKGYVIVAYTIDDKQYINRWDNTVDVNYLRRALEHRGATNILINYV